MYVNAKNAWAYYGYYKIHVWLFAYVCGLVVSPYLFDSSLLPFALSAAALTASASFKTLGKRLPAALAFLIFWAFFGLAASAAAAKSTPKLPDEIAGLTLGADAEVEAVLTRWNKRTDDSYAFEAKTSSIAINDSGRRLPFDGIVRVRLRDGSKMEGVLPGDFLKIEGRLALPSPGKNPGSLDWEGYLNRRGVSGILSVRAKDSITRLNAAESSAPFSAEAALMRVRELAAIKMKNYFPARVYGLALAMSLGDRSYMDEKTSENFRKSGTAHVIAISGLNLGIIAIWLFFLFKLPLLFAQRINYRAGRGRLTGVFTLASVWGFALIAGGEPPALRSAIMITFFIAARTVGREASSFATLSWSALFILLVSPSAIYDVSFQLTFAAVGCLLLAAPVMENLWRRFDFGESVGKAGVLLNAAAKYFYDLLWVSLVGFVSTAPIILYAFCNFTAAGLVANVIVVPLVTMAVVPLSFAAALTAVFNLPGLSLIAAPLAASLEFETQIQSVLGETLNFTASPGVVTALACAAEGVALAFILWRYKFSAWKSAAAGALCAALAFAALRPYPVPDKPRVVFFNAGYGRAAVLGFPGGKTVLIDGADFGFTGEMLRKSLFKLGLETPSVWILLSEKKRAVREEGEARLELPKPVDAFSFAAGEELVITGSATITAVEKNDAFSLYELDVNGEKIAFAGYAQQNAGEKIANNNLYNDYKLVEITGSPECSTLRSIKTQLIVSVGINSIYRVEKCRASARFPTFIPSEGGAVSCLIDKGSINCSTL